MKKLILNIALFSFVALSFTACKDGQKETATTDEKEVVAPMPEAVSYAVDLEKSVIRWTGNKPTGTHTGTIKIASGSVSVNGTNLDTGKFSIDMTSITNTDLDGEMKVNLEAHLKGTVEGKEGDFFNVTEFPLSSFVVTSVTGAEGEALVSGNLTIKEKTHNIQFPATITYTDNAMSLVSKPFNIDRTKWGVNYGSKSIFDNLGDKFISDQIGLEIELYASK